jgi:hypothetical protein
VLLLNLIRKAILCQICLYESTIAELFAQAIHKKQLTLKDRYILMTAILNNSLCQEEEVLINRLLHAVRRGMLQVVDEF